MRKPIGVTSPYRAVRKREPDLCDVLDDPEKHHPGNFDTPRRANALLSCLCQEAADEIRKLRKELADERAKRLRVPDEPLVR